MAQEDAKKQMAEEIISVLKAAEVQVQKNEINWPEYSLSEGIRYAIDIIQGEYSVGLSQKNNVTDIDRKKK